MKTKIVICPTLERALYEWRRFANAYPDMWIDVRRRPMTLTSKTGVTYIFHSKAEVDKLKGYHADFISCDEVDPLESEGE